MPWEERSLMDMRLRFVQDVHRPGWSVAEVCRRYQVSRKTGYKWLERYGKAGPAGALGRSHPADNRPPPAPPGGGGENFPPPRPDRRGAREGRGVLAPRGPPEPLPPVATAPPP